MVAQIGTRAACAGRDFDWRFRKTMNMNNSEVTIDDLRSGRVARITTRQYARLKGNSVYTPQRERVLGKGIPYQKDENGRVWYLAEDVLRDIEGRPLHKSTREYDTQAHLENLRRARLARGQESA
jgi:hypothetical protein